MTENPLPDYKKATTTDKVEFFSIPEMSKMPIERRVVAFNDQSSQLFKYATTGQFPINISEITQNQVYGEITISVTNMTKIEERVMLLDSDYAIRERNFGIPMGVIVACDEGKEANTYPHFLSELREKEYRVGLLRIQSNKGDSFDNMIVYPGMRDVFGRLQQTPVMLGRLMGEFQISVVDIPVTRLDKKGWLLSSRTSLEIPVPAETTLKITLFLLSKTV